VPPEHVDRSVNDAARKGQIVGVRISLADEDVGDEPWTLPPSRKRAEKPIPGPFPEHVDLVQCDLISMRLSTWDRQVQTLVLVHRQQLLDQWRERLAMFLGVPVKSIGQIGAGKALRKGFLDVAVIQSLQRKGEVKDFVAEYGHVIADECHHISAFTFERVIKQVKVKYVLGLTATPARSVRGGSVR
jgi:hypothetical protein